LVIDIIFSTMINGSIYSILAIGFSLVFGVARIINIAHTAFYMLAAFCIYAVTNSFGLHPVLAMAAAIIFVTILGLVSYKLIIEKIRVHDAATIIATIALAMIFQEIMILIFGAEFLSVPVLVEGFAVVFGVKITYQQIFTCIFMLIILISVWLLLMKTKLGLAIRATAQDRETANLMGMNESMIALVTVGISVGLAGFAGAIVIPLTVIHPHMWLSPLIIMMAVVVLGGLGSIKGSIIGAFIMGLAEALIVFLVPMGSFLKGSVALTILIIVLVIKPEGLFGVSIEGE
jgi:branched-chain amino acid transport system permease protein